ncbi:MAG: helix-turn-helix transcriptional regulator [Cyanobacteria bacterium RUI128]|nr:helix-turn-helix transcriptional regulator [Cyanobacteria bacterium RUI128]
MYIVNLYKIKWNRKYTQEDIINATGLSKKTVSQLFSGKHYNYQLSTLETISEFFNCDISDILIKVPDNK